MNKIEKLLNRNTLRLAPMAGISNAPFRNICKKNGSGFVTTEEIDATSLVYDKSERTKLITNFSKYEKPIAMQILGCDSKILSESSLILQDLGASIIDINMGCPVPKITKKGKGAALMKDIRKTSEIVNNLRKVTKIPLTVKIRSGWDENNINAVQFSKMLESEGVDSIAVHPRTRLQRYEGKSKWTIIKQVVDAVNIPVSGNGDVKTYEDAENMIAQTSCKSVLIGRAAIGNPWIFNRKYQKLEDHEKNIYKIKTIKNHLEMMKLFFPKKTLEIQIKKHLSYYSKGFYESREFRQKIFRSSANIEDIIKLFLDYFEKNMEKNKLEKLSV